MLDISKLTEQLSQLLQKITHSGAGRQRIILPFSSQRADTLLSWLSEQSVYPQFYWSHREGSEDVVACGAVIDFASIEHANSFIQQDPDSKTRIWGLNRFDQTEDQSIQAKGKSFFFFLASNYLAEQKLAK